MNIRSILVIILFTGSCFSQNDTIISKGIYTGKNLYQENNGCLINLYVNGKEPLFTGSNFEIDLKSMKLKLGDSVTVLVVKRKNCNAGIRNPQDILPKSNFVITSINVDSLYNLCWKDKEELGSLPFAIEQFVWNKWSKIGEIAGKGSPSENEYCFKLKPHSGKNTVRVKQIDGNAQYKISSAISFVSRISEVRLKTKKIIEKIEFSAETRYELYDVTGNAIKAGYGQTVNCSDLKKGRYFLNYDNSTTEIKLL